MGDESRAQVWGKTNGHCWYCGKLMNPWEDFTVDHIIPQVQGGGDELPNLVPCCKRCNSRKGGKTASEYRDYLAAKMEHVFWFERDPVFLEALERMPGIDPEEAPPKYQSRLDVLLYDCFYVGLHMYGGTGFAVTLISLFQDALQNYSEDGEAITGSWYFHIADLARSTNQDVETVFGHIMTMYSAQIIEMSWGQGPDGGHPYAFHFDRVRQIKDELWRKERESRETAANH